MPDATTRRDNRSTTILYIEDNPENRVLARAVLEAEGYTVSVAEDGLSGIEAAIRERPSLILLDVNLPGVDGYEAVAILKSFPNLANTPVIAVTAYAMEGDRQRALEAGGRSVAQLVDILARHARGCDRCLGRRLEHVPRPRELIAELTRMALAPLAPGLGQQLALALAGSGRE